ncbi:hypothetical protein FQN54_002932 [Arachnomyces sp. PD_36]|nr:hypothetical protein FQN54_002932 [Arachnomyces sp. PD_36]
MKPSLLVWSLLSLVAVPALASTPQDAVSDPEVHLNARGAGKDSEEFTGPAATLFNGVEVPAQKQLTPNNFDEIIKDGYWFVKHFSPSCPHCMQVAPTWQTLYEFYYVSTPDSTPGSILANDVQTSDPLSGSSTKKPADSKPSLNSFDGFYNFHFASMDCLAYGDKCRKLDASRVPTFSLYHNGEVVDSFVGVRTMKELATFVEEHLETIRPGSRPLEGLRLPEPGDKRVDPTTPLTKLQSSENDGTEAKGKDETDKPGKSNTGKEVGTKTKPKATPNPQGTSIPLTAESFQRLVTTTRDPWFIKFYAPWCSHCQALAPNWRQMAKDMKGVLNIGEVNCETESRLCKDARVKGYPTIHFFRGGERVEYEGLRGLGDLVSYAKKAVEVGSGVEYVDAESFKKMEETEEVIFLYFYDHATTIEDFDALERLTLSLVGHARLVKTNSTELAERFKISTWPRLLVSRDGRANYYTALAPKDMRDFRQVLSWMQTVWLPIVPELTVSNAREIMDGKFVVLGILSRERSDEFIQDKRELKNAALEWMDKQTQLFQLERKELRDAKQLRIEEAEDRNDQRALRNAKSRQITIREDDKKQVGFAWVDGTFWERWIRTTYGIDVKNGERVIINDQDNRRYWETTSSGAFIMPSRTSILETLPLVITSPPSLAPKSTVGSLESVFFSTRAFAFAHPFIASAALFVCMVMSLFWARGKFRRSRGGSGPGGIIGAGPNAGGGFFHLEGKEGLLNGEGGNGNGKVD